MSLIDSLQRAAKEQGTVWKKKKKSSEESQIQESDDVFLPPVAEVSSQASKVQMEHPGEFTEIWLSDEAEDGKTINDVCDIPQSNLPSANERSLVVILEPPTNAEEFKADPSHEECGGDVEKSGKGKSDKPHSPVEAVASGSGNSDLMSSTFPVLLAPRQQWALYRTKKLKRYKMSKILLSVLQRSFLLVSHSSLRNPKHVFSVWD